MVRTSREAKDKADLGCLLVVLDGLLLNIVVRPERLLEVRSDHRSRAFRWGSSDKEHHTTTVVLVCGLQESNSYAHSNTCATQRTLVCGDWPGIALKLFQDG